MVGLLEKTRALFGARAEAQKAAPFALKCRCGETVHGHRMATSQVEICPTCGAKVFVFPATPLPPPPVPAEPKKGKRKRAAASAPFPTVDGKALGRNLSQAALSVARALIPPRHWFTVPRLLGAAVCLIVVAAVWQQYLQHQRQALREEIGPLARRGLSALSDGDFEVAHAQLKKAVDDLNRLGESYPDDERYRQAFAELDVRQRLLSQSLEIELEAMVGHEARASDVLRGKAVILATTVRRGAEGGWEIGYLPMWNTKPLPFHEDGLKLFERFGGDADAVWVFGAIIDGIAATPGGEQRLRLDPESGVLMTEARILAEIGLLRDPSVEEIRRRQQDLVRPANDPAPGG